MKYFTPVLAVDNLQVHVDSGDEHLTVDADLVDGRRRQSVGHHHHPHDLIGHRAAVGQGHPDPETTGDVDHLEFRDRRERVRDVRAEGKRSVQRTKCVCVPKHFMEI